MCSLFQNVCLWVSSLSEDPIPYNRPRNRILPSTSLLDGSKGFPGEMISPEKGWCALATEVGSQAKGEGHGRMLNREREGTAFTALKTAISSPRESFNTPASAVVSYSYGSQLAQTGWPKTEMYTLTVLEARDPRSCSLSWVSGHCCQSLAFLDFEFITSMSLSMVTWSSFFSLSMSFPWWSLLCVSVSCRLNKDTSYTGFRAHRTPVRPHLAPCLHLQGPNFQTRSCSQVPGFRISLSLLGGTLFNLQRQASAYYISSSAMSSKMG